MNIDIKNNINIFLFTQLELNNQKNAVNLQIVNTKVVSLIARLAGSPCFLEFQDC